MNDETYGIIGVFTTPSAMTAAAARIVALGFRRVEAYAPCPVPEAARILHPQHSRRRWFLAAALFLGGVSGALWGYFIQYWDAVLSYPIIVGGRPLDSWPAFIVSAVEFGLLCAIAAGLFALLVTCRLPLLYDPIDNAEEIVRASRDRFVLFLAANDASFERGIVRRLFERLDAERIEEVAR
ncbi:MAG TPA: DUF3341 domain-containing protein [Stellaceae bacterium]|nr:DUF3341 domain-containing protein [Stellaceae bacterium]